MQFSELGLAPELLRSIEEQGYTEATPVQQKAIPPILLGRDVMAAVRSGRKQDHGPIPKLPSTGRRRMDRQTERRLAALKRWRTTRAQELSMDPGVLCPNSALEAIALSAPSRARELENVPELKRWFAREFGAEAVAVASDADASEHASR